MNKPASRLPSSPLPEESSRLNPPCPGTPLARNHQQQFRQTRAVTPIRATVRLQLHQNFGFDAAAAQISYFARLGISHYYLSPVLTARAGSPHGYDVVDHATVNPELGGEAGLQQLSQALKKQGMGLIVDIVPNHMAVGRDDNAWWLDVLEWGRDSPYAHFFDIDWDVPDPALRNRVLAPFLGKPYGEALADGELRLRLDEAGGRFFVSYFDHRFPLAPADYAPLLREAGASLSPLAGCFAEAAAATGQQARRLAFAQARQTLARAGASASSIRDPLRALVKRYAANAASGGERLHRLLDRQHYRLAWWRTALDEINWRRFFDIIDLAALRIQEPAVFNAVHATVFRLYAEGLIDGVRVDHVDGLADPRAYCRKLRTALDKLTAQRPQGSAPGRAYIVVEKILAPGEQLARAWGVDGTSGYVFMNDVGAVQHDPGGEHPLTQLWKTYSGRSAGYEEEERSARRRIPQELFASEFNACAHALHAIARSRPEWRDWTLGAIRRVLAELLAHFPVYRIYADTRGRSEADAAIMAKVVADAKKTCRPGEQALVDAMDRWLGGEPPRQVTGAAARRMRLRAIARFQQLTSPVAAKAVEDTAFYRYGRLLSRNEVGADPAQFSMSVKDFHHACAERRRRYPMAMLATATHDHKRGEDTRARLAVLSEMPAAWGAAIHAWTGLNAPLKSSDGPAAEDEYLLYQMMTGAWPMDLSADDAEGLHAYADRLLAWQRKAIREAKRHSNWTEPNLAYEGACADFLRQLFNPARSSQFLREIRHFVEDIAAAGAVNGLAQAILRMTTPGIPDLYQGTELWDYSLVDPDNRRPVDFEIRAGMLDGNAPMEALMSRWTDGGIKQRIISRTLATRSTREDLYARGRYLPLRVRSKHSAHLLAFARVHHDAAAIVVTTRLPGALLKSASIPLVNPLHWESTAIELPDEFAGKRWHDALCSAECIAGHNSILAEEVLKRAPVALLIAA